MAGRQSAAIDDNRQSVRTTEILRQDLLLLLLMMILLTMKLVNQNFVNNTTTLTLNSTGLTSAG